MSEIKLNSIEDAVKDFKEGKFVIVVDDEDRENEGDLIIAAEKIDTEKVNFMLKHARGVLCAPITLSRCDELDLPHQVSENTSVLGTPFTITVDKLEGCSTGVSAHDRAETIKALADPNSTPQTFGRPGHINPLYAQDNGVLRRSGHTEAAIDLCKMAGLYPAGALMEIMNEDGTMARLPELMKMAKEEKRIPKAAKEKTKTKTSAAAKDLSNEEAAVFEKLRALRMELAKEHKVPPYIIFSDKTLIQMAMEKPSNKEEMLAVSGVGESKFEKYGEPFLACLAER